MMKILAASALTIGLAASAMAQSAETTSGSHRSWLFGNEDTPVDRNTTGSIAGSDASGLNTPGNAGPMGPCAYNTSGPDANAGQNVNDQYCGK
ncbi:hypothetical protein [Mesorhizobium sp. 131-2-1]|uniref:hypothetical protein n=1 Tax=Mesorhizobium sp. 131-2-1 TaxID=2744518 RepID=UPI00192912EA|nr:hypothetical protein [Mesorhizobium sp. 131-2-1]BCG94353.1 hypothetical protein MesoLj131a_32170 [Mesorhizobium sp. 131-2-1]